MQIFIFRVVTLNVRGAKCEAKRRAIFDKYREITDLLILQETHSTPDEELIWRNQWGGEIIYSHGESNSHGVCVCYKKELKDCISNVYSSEDGKLIIFNLKEEDHTISVAALYAPNKDSPAFFENIRLLMKERSEKKLIIGDFNLTMDVELDRLNTYNNNTKARDVVEDMAEEYCMKDVWRIQNGEKKEYSWIKCGA